MKIPPTHIKVINKYQGTHLFSNTYLEHSEITNTVVRRQVDRDIMLNDVGEMTS